MTKRVRFSTQLVQGHKQVVVAIVPFDPVAIWGAQPIMIDARRHGWLVRGSINGVQLDGWIGERWGRFFVIIDAAMRAAASAEAGDPVELVLQPTKSKTALAIAQAQAPLTTAPKARATSKSKASRSSR